MFFTFIDDSERVGLAGLCRVLAVGLTAMIMVRVPRAAH